MKDFPVGPLALASLLVAPFTVHAETPVALPALDVVSTPIIEANRVDPFAGVSTVVGEDQVRDLNAQDSPSVWRSPPGGHISATTRWALSVVRKAAGSSCAAWARAARAAR